MKEQLLTTLENSRKYTMAVADAMSEKHYSFKPVDTVWNFGELLQHIAYGIHWWEENFIKGNKVEWAPPAVSDKKKKVAESLTSAYDALSKTISKGNLSEEAVKGFHATIDHITHHRGQAVLFLRLQGIVPPEYTY
jgi:uncharacterized damage-inducible protein DinB